MSVLSADKAIAERAALRGSRSLPFLSDILPQASLFVVLRRKKGHPGISLDPVDVIVNRSHAAHIFGDDPDGVAFSFIGQYAM
jgi:hypothetical protein